MTLKGGTIMTTYNIYVVLTRTNTMISRLIQGIKHDQYTHASISLDKELRHMYSFGRKYTYNPFIGRFRKEDINEGVFKLCDTLPGAIVELEVSQQQYERTKAILDIFITNTYLYKYNYMGLIHSFLNKPALSENRFLCSEFVYHILAESNILDLNISRNLVRPQNFLYVGGKVIYEGDLKVLELSEKNIHKNTVRPVQLSTQ